VILQRLSRGTVDRASVSSTCRRTKSLPNEPTPEAAWLRSGHKGTGDSTDRPTRDFGRLPPWQSSGLSRPDYHYSVEGNRFVAEKLLPPFRDRFPIYRADSAWDPRSLPAFFATAAAANPPLAGKPKVMCGSAPQWLKTFGRAVVLNGPGRGRLRANFPGPPTGRKSSRKRVPKWIDIRHAGWF